MEGKGYTSEAHHLCIIRNWWRACDERGLTGSQRNLYNNEFLEYLLDNIPYTAKLLRAKTFAVGIEKDCSQENFRGSSISQ